MRFLKDLALYLLCGPGSYLVLVKTGVAQIPDEEFVGGFLLVTTLALGVTIIEHFFGSKWRNSSGA